MFYDTDDILFRNAVYEKVKYLESHPDCAVPTYGGYYVEDGIAEIANE